MGISSIGILLHEVIKLMAHARVKDPVFFRIGSCGGIGIEGGTVVISDDAVDAMLNHYYEVVSSFSSTCLTLCTFVHTCTINVGRLSSFAIVWGMKINTRISTHFDEIYSCIRYRHRSFIHLF